MGDEIVENYQERFTYINEYVRKFLEKHNNKDNMIPPLKNFSIYMRFDLEQPNDLLKW